MLTRFIPLAIAACALVAGCTTMHPRVERVAKKLDCDGSKECTVTVTVNCLHYLGCDVSVDYDLVFVAGKNKQTDIRWKLVGEKAKVGLFDLSKDISEKSDLAKALPEKVAELTKLHDAWLAEMPNPIKAGGKRYGLEAPAGTLPKKAKADRKKKKAPAAANP